MDIKELRKLPLPKLRDLAKEATDLTGVIGMKKEELIEAIAKAKGIAYEAAAKDVATISSVKQGIRALQKKKAEILSSSRDRAQLDRLREKVKKLKRGAEVERVGEVIRVDTRSDTYLERVKRS